MREESLWRILLISRSTPSLTLSPYVAAYAFYAWLYQQKLMEVKDNFEPDFQLKLTAIYPVVSIILCILAFRGIKRDEKLIRSLERIR